MSGRLFIPAIHLPHGREVFKPLPYRASQFRRVLKAYAERALLQCTPEDAIVLAAPPEPDHLRFLLDNGIGTERIFTVAGNGGNLAQDIIAEGLPGRMAGCGGPNFYIHLEEEEEIARALGHGHAVMHPALTRMFNTTYFLLRLEEDMAAPSIPRRQLRSSRFEEPARDLLAEHGTLFVRGNESCGGTQTSIIRTEADIAAVANKVRRNRQITRYFASPLLEIEESWNVQYLAAQDGTYSLYGASRQLLDGTAHKGNEAGAPLPEEAARLAGSAMKRLAAMGAKGLIGIDLITTHGKCFIAEINARENTSTPVIAAAKRFNARYWRTFKMPVPKGYGFGNFTAQAGKERLFNAATKRGLLPFHFAAARLTGWLDVAAFGEDAEEAAALAEVLYTA